MRLTLGEFIEHRYKVKDLAFGQLTEQFIHDYQAFATGNKGYAIDTIRHHLAIMKKYKNFGASQTNKCMCWLNRLLYLAVDKEIIRVNPCEDVEYEPKPEARHKYISREEFKKILSTPMYNKRMELARRAFIFSTLTGLAYVDIKLLHPHHIGTNAEGRRFIRKPFLLFSLGWTIAAANCGQTANFAPSRKSGLFLDIPGSSCLAHLFNISGIQ